MYVSGPIKWGHGTYPYGFYSPKSMHQQTKRLDLGGAFDCCTRGLIIEKIKRNFIVGLWKL